MRSTGTGPTAYVYGLQHAIDELENWIGTIEQVIDDLDNSLPTEDKNILNAKAIDDIRKILYPPRKIKFKEDE